MEKPDTTSNDIWKDEKDAKPYEEWISRPLRFLSEPSLWELFKNSPEAQIFRVTKLPSFTIPTIVRIEVQNNGSATLYRFDPAMIKFEIIERKTGEDLLAILKRRNVSTIDQNQLQRVTALFEASGIWADKTDPAERSDAKEGFLGFDGNSYFIEPVYQGQYKIAWRHGCRLETEIIAIIDSFAKLSKSTSLDERC